jgi:hypothetical protein
MRPYRLPRNTQAVLPPSLKAAHCRQYPRRGVSERRTRRPAVTSAREPRGLRARQAAPDAGTRRGIARGAGAQASQQVERRQRGGNRAVELIRAEIPATCMICAEYWTGTSWVLTEHENAMGYCQRYRVPHGAGPLRGLLQAYSRPRAARLRARQCDGACGRTKGCLRTPTGRRSHAGARPGIARGAGAQIFQLIERRQRGGDCAVERVKAEIPATCMVRLAVQ